MLINVVDHVVHHFFVAGYGRRGYNDRIVVAKLNFGELTRSNASKRAHGFALAAGSNDDKFFIFLPVYHVYIDDARTVQFEFAYFRGAFDDVYHTSAGKRDFAVKFFGKVDDLLQSVDV